MNNNNNHHSSACAFGELLVAYLYAEANDEEKNIFEAHLASCQNCQTELSAFGETSQFVRNWRDTEFAPLPNPLIELPFINYGERKPQTLLAETSPNWWEKIRQFFAFPQSFAVGASACAALVLLVFGVLVFSKMWFAPNTNNEVVQANKPTKTETKTTPTPSPIVETNSNSSDKSTQTTKNAPAKKPTDSPAVKIADNNPPKVPTVNQSPRKIPATSTAIPNQVNRPKTNPVQNRPKNQPSNEDLQEVEKGFRELLDKNEKENSLSILDIVGEVGEK